VHYNNYYCFFPRTYPLFFFTLHSPLSRLPAAFAGLGAVLIATGKGDVGSIPLVLGAFLAFQVRDPACLCVLFYL
jgi:hypothetical protein